MIYANHLKSILSNNITKICFECSVTRLGKIQLGSQECVLVSVDMIRALRNFLSRKKLISLFFLKKCIKKLYWFFIRVKLIHFYNKVNPFYNANYLILEYMPAIEQFRM